jgi:SAM-dependent methyltransferase
MSQSRTSRKSAQTQKSAGAKIDYGIDSPGLVRVRIIAGIACLFAAVGFSQMFRSGGPLVMAIFFNVLFWPGLLLVVFGGLMVYSSKVGKVRMSEAFVADLHLRGDETVLDVGCGRGLLAIAVARQLTTGKVVGVDIWNEEDLSDNSLAAAQTNVAAAGVASRVEIKSADMRKLPLLDAAVDLVVSSLALHCLDDREERTVALREFARVLKAGGRLAIVDSGRTAALVEDLRGLDWQDVERSSPGYALFPPARRVVARKRAI